METLHLSTPNRECMVNITGQIRELVQRNSTSKGWKNGAVLIYSPHTTSAITINEGADPDVCRDIVVNMKKLVPHSGDYHHAEGNSDAHIKSSMFGCGQLVPVEDGEIRLGTWQRIFFCEFDGPRSRNVWVQWLSC